MSGVQGQKTTDARLAGKTLVHMCSFFHTSQVHKSLFDQLRVQTGYHQVIIVPTKNRGNSVIVDNTALGTMIEVPCLDLATSLSAVFRGKKIYKMLLRGGVPDLLEKCEVELVHSHSAYADAFASQYLAQALGSKHAISFRATDVQFCFRYRPHASHFMKRIVRDAERLMVISHGDASRTANRLGVDSARIYLFGSGVNDFYIDNARLHKDRAPGNNLAFLTMGKAGYPYKKLPLTIKSCEAAASRLKQDSWSLKVLGMSYAQYKSTFRTSLSQLLLNNHVEFLGRIQDPREVLDLMHTSSAFVLPSKETFGISFLEAISQCTPVVYLKDHAIDGIFDDSYIGASCSSQTVDAVSNAIVGVIERNGGVLGPFDQNPVARLSWEMLARRYAADVLHIAPPQP